MRVQSLPSRERGLKFDILSYFSNPDYVAPLAGAWIEILLTFHQFRRRASLPSRERGLK